MSFSSSVKEELVRLPLGKPCCMLSELSALTRTSGSLSMHGMGRVLATYRVENAGVARRIFLLLRTSLGVTPRLHFVQQPRLGGRRICVLTLGDQESLKLLTALHMAEEDEDGGLSFKRTPPRHPMTRECCRRAFLRAAFLGAGSMTDPEKSYHFEWMADSDALLKELSRLMEKSKLPVRSYLRRGVTVLYLKGAEDIARALALMGASKSVLTLESLRVQKQMHGQTSRVITCDENNINRASAAADRQSEAIARLLASPEAGRLPDTLKEMARLRLENPDLTLTELGQLMNPPLSKSGVNHRMRRLTALAAGLDGQTQTDTEEEPT